jgi:hypothetical protein
LAIVDHRIFGLVTALVQNAKRANIGHHIIAVCSDNEIHIREFTFGANGIIEHNFST